MPTKLKKPITITITHVENAVWAALKLRSEWDENAPRHQAIEGSMAWSQMGHSVYELLQAEGIDYRTWEPPQPIYIAGCEADFKSNGNVKLGSETLDRATLVEVLKRSDEAMNNAEPEWPKFWRYGKSRLVYKAEDEHCFGHLSANGGPWSDCPMGGSMVEFARRDELFKPIPRAEASAILGGDV